MGTPTASPSHPLTLLPFHSFTILLFQAALDFLDKHIKHFGDFNAFEIQVNCFLFADVTNSARNFKLSQEFRH